MALGRIRFDELAERDLVAMVEVGISEGTSIEYKSAAYGRSESDVKEFLKDISSFANTTGGHLVIGMRETNGGASEIIPLKNLSIDEEMQRLGNLIRDGLEPRISGILVRAIPISAGGSCIVVRIPRSWNPPHRVSVRNNNRFYLRNSSGAHEASVEELRALFNMSATALDRTRAFRRERLLQISSGEAQVRLADYGGKIVLHVVPLSAFSSREQIDVQRAMQLQEMLSPISSPGHSPRYNFDGIINVRGEHTCYGYTQLFRNGCIEAIKVGAVMEREGQLIIASLDFFNHTLEVLPHYLNALKDLEISPPHSIMITLDGIAGALLGVSQDQLLYNPPVPIAQQSLELPEVFIDSYGTQEDYKHAIRPAFDALWNAAGYAASCYFDENIDENARR